MVSVVAASEATTEAGVLRDDNDEPSECNEEYELINNDSIAASLEAASKKRKRPTASLLKLAMEDLDRIWMNASVSEEDHQDGDDEGTESTTKRANSNRGAHRIPVASPVTTVLPPSEMDRVRQTTDLLVKVLTQDIHEPAIRALVNNEELEFTQLKLKTELETNRKEMERLRRSEKRSKEAIQNLLKAVGQSAEETIDASQSKLVEAKMRADLLHAISQRDSAQKDSMVTQRSFDLLAGDVENLKKDRNKLQHDKLRLEREVRSARAIAEQLSSSLMGSNHHKDDLNYYKGKSKELEIHLEGMTTRMVEKNQEIQELRRCNDRNWSQQRLNTLKKAGEPSTGSHGTSKTKRSRHSL